MLPLTTCYPLQNINNDEKSYNNTTNKKMKAKRKKGIGAEVRNKNERIKKERNKKRINALIKQK